MVERGPTQMVLLFLDPVTEWLTEWIYGTLKYEWDSLIIESLFRK